MSADYTEPALHQPTSVFPPVLILQFPHWQINFAPICIVVERLLNVSVSTGFNIVKFNLDMHVDQYPDIRGATQQAVEKVEVLFWRNINQKYL